MTIRDNMYKYISELTSIPTVYVGAAPQDSAFPYIIITRINHVPDYTFYGESGLVNELWQIDIWAQTALAVESAYEKIRTAFSGFAGQIGVTGSKTTILDSYINDAIDQVSVADDGSQDLYYRCIVDVAITYRS